MDLEAKRLKRTMMYVERATQSNTKKGAFKDNWIRVTIG